MGFGVGWLDAGGCVGLVAGAGVGLGVFGLGVGSDVNGAAVVAAIGVGVGFDETGADVGLLVGSGVGFDVTGAGVGLDVSAVPSVVLVQMCNLLKLQPLRAVHSPNISSSVHKRASASAQYSAAL